MTDILATLLGAVTLLNRIISAGILITAFALVIYIGLYNRRSQIARTFALLLLCAIGAYLGDLLGQLSTSPAFEWMRFQWIGIAMMPAAALGMSDTLLRATGETSPVRRIAVRAGYITGVVLFLLVVFTDLVAVNGLQTSHLQHLNPGLLFYVFSLYYFSSVGWAMYNVIEARRRSLTATSKRRMTYFTLSFLFPTLGIFPFLLPVGWPMALPEIIPWTGILVVNTAIGAGITLMGYSVAYYGASAPDRVIKRRLIKFLFRGPILAAVVITALVMSSRVEKLFGLPSDFVGLIAASTMILLAQLFIVTLQPTMDRLIAGEDSGEVTYLQQFSERLMTTSDLRQFLENILAALCDLLRARTAFVMKIADRDMPIQTLDADPNTPLPVTEPVLVVIGNLDIDKLTPQSALVRSVIQARSTNGKTAEGAKIAETMKVDQGAPSGDAAAAQPGEKHETTSAVNPEDKGAEPGQLHTMFEIEHDFILWEGYWLIPLRSRETSEVLGVIGLVARASEPELTDEERQGVATLVAQASHALEDSIMQRRAFEALTSIIPEADDMQRRIAETRNPAAPTIADFELAPEGYDDFTHLVRNALSQYWGGPKLVGSPMMKLHVVTDAMEANNGNATKALRAVLAEAIERLKPGGARSLTATEWLLYNILDMKIVQGQRVRDVARKLVMSESDLYRKQRAAFEEVARIVMEMEREARNKPDKSAVTPSKDA
jgi:GAF domain-containing protein